MNIIMMMLMMTTNEVMVVFCGCNTSSGTKPNHNIRICPSHKICVLFHFIPKTMIIDVMCEYKILYHDTTCKLCNQTFQKPVLHFFSSINNGLKPAKLKSPRKLGAFKGETKLLSSMEFLVVKQ